MTLLSRKKRQTTRPNTEAAKTPSQGARRPARGLVQFDRLVPEPSPAEATLANRQGTWLPAALLATLMMLASSLQAFGQQAPQLGWRAASSSRSGHTQRNKTRPIETTVHKAPAHAQWQQAARVRVTRQTDERGYAVMQVSYDESPALPEQGVARLQSVVVHPRDPRFAGTGPVLRVAQNSDPFGDDINQDDELSRDILQEFNGDTTDTIPELESSVLPQPAAGDGDPELTPPDGFDMRDNGLEVLDDPSTDPTVMPTAQPELEPRAEKLSAKARAELEKERRKSAEIHAQALADLRSDSLSEIELDIRVRGQEGLNYPYEGQYDDGELYAGRHWPEVTYMWKAAANCHKPLYFEQPQLERYGHSWGPYAQPLVSGAHFFTRLPVLPYAMGIRTPTECVYPLGHYRPGNCAPYVIPAVPFTWRAALFEAGAVTGTAFILP